MYSQQKLNIDKVIQEEILECIAPNIKDIILKIPKQHIFQLEEIRIRINKPLMICRGCQDEMVSPNGDMVANIKDAYIVTKGDCDGTLHRLSNYSIYAIEEELRNGYITLRGGHRVGIVGKGVIEGGKLKTLKNISGFNIRIAREVLGSADNVVKYIVKSKTSIYNTIIISPPQCGKTTILRDIVRQISNGQGKYIPKGLKVGLVDERSEIAGSYQGEAQNDVGIRTDVLDGCLKSSGIIMLIRSMSPKVVATDEVGNRLDCEAIYEAANAGVNIVTTIHGDGLEDVLKRPFINEVLKDGVFERIIVLSNRYGPGTIEQIIDGLTLEDIVNIPFR